MQYSQEHLKTMVYAKFGGRTECIMGNWKIENTNDPSIYDITSGCRFGAKHQDMTKMDARCYLVSSLFAPTG